MVDKTCPDVFTVTVQGFRIKILPCHDPSNKSKMNPNHGSKQTNKKTLKNKCQPCGCAKGKMKGSHKRSSERYCSGTMDVYTIHLKDREVNL